MQQGFFYDFSNYGSYDRLADDGLTQWHPAFLRLGVTLELCAAAYRKFCKHYKPQPKPEKRNHWGSKFLEKIKQQGKPKKTTPGQKSLWDEWDKPLVEIQEVAEKFVMANCFDPQFASQQFQYSFFDE
jgi:putative transposase